MKWTAVAVEVTPSGTVLKNPNGMIRSLNPDNGPAGGPYHWEERDKPGPFEYVTIENGRVAYNPMAFYGEPGEAVVFGFMDKAPNSSYSWLTLEPLTI